MLPNESNLDFDLTLESERSGVIDESVFQILVLGDWSANGVKRGLGSRSPVEIDRDNFDEVLGKLGVRLRTEAAGVLEFGSLDDFHPDDIFKKVPAFAELRDLRGRLRDPETFHSAAREMRETVGDSEGHASVPPAPARVEEEGGSLLDAVLSRPAGGGERPKPALSPDISQLVNDLVRPHIVSVDENERSSLVAAVDAATSDLMRSILHDREFRSLEAAWRGLFFLVRRTDTSADLKIFILDVTKEELASDLKNAKDLKNSAYFRWIAAGHRDDPWAAVFGNFAFAPEVDDVAALVRIAKIGAASDTPFISHIRPEVLGIHSLAENPDSSDWDFSGNGDTGKLWSALRSIPESKFLGLVMPRFLARLPYGAETEPTEAFMFEEFTEGFSHDDYVWANGCFAAAQLLGATYRELGWDFGNRFVQDADGLPLHIYKRGGETVYQSSAEAQLSQAAAERMMEHGLMPLVSFKNMDRIRLVRFQSTADPVGALKGKWS